jgi:hypothetical protein
MQTDSVGAHPIFTPAGEAVLLWLFVGAAAAVVLAALWRWHRRRRR